jgi:hypothetical protein
MSIRTQWTDVSKETRKYIKKRDGNKCIICNNKGAITMAHVFVSRAKGGKGSKENIVSLCTNCHYYILDNPIGQKNNKLSQEYKAKCYQYLFDKENIIYNDEFIKSLKFDKQRYIDETEPNIKSIQIKKYNRCKDCEMLVKRSSYNSLIPTYYCKYRKINLNKTTKACNKFKKRLGKS